MDGDPDLEATFGSVPPGGVDEGEPGGDDEPSFGWTETEARFGCKFAGDLRDEAEPEEDYEPSLGALNPFERTSQETWGRGGCDDREDDLSDNEPSLCGVTAGGTMGNDQDLEADLGSFDRIVNQEHALRTRSNSFVSDGEVSAVDLRKIDATRKRRNADRERRNAERQADDDGCRLVNVTIGARPQIVKIVPLA